MVETFYYGTHFACSKNFKLKNPSLRFKMGPFLKYLDFQQEISTVANNTFQNHIGHTFITSRCKIMQILNNYWFSLYGSKKWVFSNFEGNKKEKSKWWAVKQKNNYFSHLPMKVPVQLSYCEMINSKITDSPFIGHMPKKCHILPLNFSETIKF